MNVCNLGVRVKLAIRTGAATANDSYRENVMSKEIPPIFRRWSAFAALLLIAACGQSKQAGGPPAMPPTQVVTLAVQPRTLPVSYEYVGQTIGSKEVEVRARVTGILEQRLYTEGSRVAAGQTLFVIDPKPFAAQVAAAEAEVARVQAQVAQANRELARLKPLAEKRAVGQKEADDAASNADLAQASLKAAQAKLTEAQLNLGYTKALAPISGLSSRANKSEGSLVTANDTLLTTISQIDPIWVPFSVSENDQLKLNKLVAAGTLTLPRDNAYAVTVKLTDGTVFPRQGKINFSDTRVNPATGTYEMRAEIKNGDAALKPGQFVRVKLSGALRNNVLAVPQVAVLDGTQGKYVYVVGKDKDGKDIAEQRNVTLGEWVDTDAGNLWIVEAGLKAGDTVIVDGIARLRPGAQVAAGGAAPPGAPAAPGKDGAAKDAPAKDAPPKSAAPAAKS
jgi:membrane fusion protein (multidrug efflux system)